MDRQLLDYLPPKTQEFREIKSIMHTEQKEVSNTWNEVDKVLNNQFIKDADLKGISRWEKVYDITPHPADSLQDRKFRIIAKTTEQLPYTWDALKQQLDTLCGKEGWSLYFEGPFNLYIKVELTAKNNFDDVKSLLKRMIPVNININLSLLYNQHEKLAGYTHQQLYTHTHEQLRNEVL